MKFEEFSKARKQILINKDKSLNEDLFAFLNKKYELDAINESLLSSIGNWIRRHFSPTASKLKTLSNEYYEWLLNEYASMYKGEKKDSALDSFFKKERISEDIESKMKQLGEKSEVYSKLASELILDSRLKAKKEYASRLLGMKSSYVSRLNDEYKKQNDKVDKLFDEMSDEERINFEHEVRDLSMYIKNSAKWLKSDDADKLSLGITKFAQIRKVENSVNYDQKTLQKYFETCEKPYFENNEDERGYKGIEYVYSARCFEDKDWLRKKTISVKDLEDFVEQTKKNVQRLDDDKWWPFVRVFLMKKTYEGRKAVQQLIEELGDSPKISYWDLESLSEEVSKYLNSHDDAEGAEQIMRNALKREVDDNKDVVEVEPKEEEPETDEPVEIEPESGENFAKDAIEHVESKLSLAEQAVRDMVLAVGSAETNSKGKLVFDPSAKKTLSYRQAGLDPHKKGLDPVLVENAKWYIKKVNDINFLSSELGDRNVKSSADALISDVKNIIERSAQNAEFILGLSDDLLILLFLRMLKYRKLDWNSVPEKNMDLIYGYMFKKEYSKTLV